MVAGKINFLSDVKKFSDRSVPKQEKAMISHILMHISA